jgi:hypothetical protein
VGISQISLTAGQPGRYSFGACTGLRGDRFGTAAGPAIPSVPVSTRPDPTCEAARADPGRDRRPCGTRPIVGPTRTGKRGKRLSTLVRGPAWRAPTWPIGLRLPTRRRTAGVTPTATGRDPTDLTLPTVGSRGPGASGASPSPSPTPMSAEPAEGRAAAAAGRASRLARIFHHRGTEITEKDGKPMCSET